MNKERPADKVVCWDFVIRMSAQSEHRMNGSCRVRAAGAAALVQRLNDRYGVGSHWIEQEDHVDG